MTVKIPELGLKAKAESVKNYFYGPSFNIHKTNVKESDPVLFVLFISAAFSLLFSIVFKSGFAGFTGLLSCQLKSMVLSNDTVPFIWQVLSLVLTFGSVILAVAGSLLIQKKKYVCFTDAAGLVLFAGSLVHFYHATYYFNVTADNWFLYLIYIIPTIIFVFASGVLTFRFFVKLIFRRNVYTEIRKLDYDYRKRQGKDIFKRIWIYFKNSYGQILTLLALISLAVAVLYPLIILLMRSINDPIADMKNPFVLPVVQSFDNYTVIWDYIKDAFINSLVTTLGVTLGTMICASLLAFAFIRFQFRGKSILYFAIIGLMMIPGILTLISRYQLVQQLGLVDDGYQDYITRFKIWGGIILPGIAGYIPMAFMLLFTFFKGIPHNLFEAADVDGASNFGVFLNVVIPLSKPILSTIAIQTFVGEWNDYLWANLVHGNDGASATLPVILQTLSHQAENGALYYSTVFAGYVLSAIPLVLIFIVASKQFIEGLTSGAFKM